MKPTALLRRLREQPADWLTIAELIGAAFGAALLTHWLD